MFDENFMGRFEEIGSFDAVIDPFFDLYLEKVIPLMSINGKYVTCGLFDQFSNILTLDSPEKSLNFKAVLIEALVKNIQIIGNCLGKIEDGEEALKDMANGEFQFKTMNEYGMGEESEFLRLNYDFSEKFGKPVYFYREAT